jgi:hypothetical protein
MRSIYRSRFTIKRNPRSACQRKKKRWNVIESWRDTPEVGSSTSIYQHVLYICNSAPTQSPGKKPSLTFLLTLARFRSYHETKPNCWCFACSHINQRGFVPIIPLIQCIPKCPIRGPGTTMGAVILRRPAPQMIPRSTLSTLVPGLPPIPMPIVPNAGRSLVVAPEATPRPRRRPIDRQVRP